MPHHHPSRARRAHVAFVAALLLIGASSLAGCGSGSQARAQPALPPATVVFPIVLEKSGRITNTAFTFDTQIFAAYSGGAAGLAGGGGATLEMYMFDAVGGQPTVDVGGIPICNPCTAIELGVTQRTAHIQLDEILTDAGYFQNNQVFDGFLVFNIFGDAQHVTLQGITMSTGNTPGDLSIFTFAPQEISSSD